MNSYNVLNGFDQRELVVKCIAENVGAFDCWFGDSHVYHYNNDGQLTGSEHAFMSPDTVAVFVAGITTKGE